MRRRGIAVPLVLGALLLLAGSADAKVLRVGSYHGMRGQYATIAAAVSAARPGDWILIGPGDYKTRSSRHPRGRADLPAGVLMTTRDVYLRGMNRNTVVVDGTKPGSPTCSRRAADQNLGPPGHHGRLGLNGVLVWKAANVWVQNLTACNFLRGSGDAGNEIWWNGGDRSRKVGGHGYLGSYLTTTSTFFKGEKTAAGYGIFSSNWSGGTWDQTYASNFNDSGLYIGACQQVCDQTVNHTWSEFNDLGYSGSNSGGKLVVENSQFDNNEDGFDTNSQNGDNPPPQNGACPGNGISPITHTHSCWVFIHNYVHDNNNPNVPAAGTSAAGPVGTGMSVSGARNDTVMDNTFVHNDAWGVILVPYPDSGPPCIGGTPNGLGAGSCLFDEWGDALIGNRFGDNGSYGHPSNGDFAQANLESNPPDCYRANTEIGGGSLRPASAAAAQQANPTCNGVAVKGASTDPKFFGEVLCDSQITPGSACPTGPYPRRHRVVMHRLPQGLKTMPNPCAGVPTNPWCPRRRRGQHSGY